MEIRKFNERLKQARKEIGLTQKEIAENINLDRTTYIGYEKGRTEPNLETLVKLSETLQVSTDWLLGIGAKKGRA